MEDIVELYQEMDNHNIIFEVFPMRQTKSISLMDKHGDCYIGMDFQKIQSLSDEKITLAHEIGHCVTGSFYNRYSKLNDIEQKEHRADAWAVKKIIPFEELEEAFQNGIVEIWELAEHFDVPEEFVLKTLQVYEEMGIYHKPICVD